MGFFSPYFDPFDDETRPHGLKTIFVLLGTLAFSFSLTGLVLPFTQYPFYPINVPLCFKVGLVLFVGDILLFPRVINWRSVYESWDENVKANQDREIPPAIRETKVFKFLMFVLSLIVLYGIVNAFIKMNGAQVWESKVEIAKVFCTVIFLYPILVAWFLLKRIIVKIFKI